jgi:Na+/glutamate symporter
MKLNYLEKKMIKIINKLSPILLIIYCVTIFLIILPYFICFKALLKNNLNYSN